MGKASPKPESTCISIINVLNTGYILHMFIFIYNK